MEEKHKFLLIFNFVLFPIVMIIFSVLTFQGTDTHIDYVDPVDPVCPNDGYIQKGNFCYVSDCFDKEETCDKIPMTCPAGKYLNSDDLCYKLLQYSDPVEAHCPQGYFLAGDVCLPNDVTIEEHETRKISLECQEDRVLWNNRCFVLSELVEEPCHKNKKDNSKNTCNASNKSEETFTKAVKCSSSSSSSSNSQTSTNEEQVSFNNKCYKERRITANAPN